MSICKSSIFIYSLLHSLFTLIGYYLIITPMVQVVSSSELQLTTISLLFLAMFLFSIFWGLTSKFMISKRSNENNKTEERALFIISGIVILFLSFVFIYTT